MSAGSPKVLIVGAGPTGLTAAMELARQGIVPRVVEKRATPSPFSRAVGILPPSMALLEPSGLADQIRNQAWIVRRLLLHRGEKPVAVLRADLLDNPNHRLFALPQDKTETLLRQNFESHGGSVEYGSALQSIDQDEDGAVALIEGEESRYDFVLAADGVRSTVRQQLGIGFDGIDLPEKWSIADVQVSHWPDADGFKIFLLDDGMVAIAIPLEKNRIRIIASTDDALAAYPHPVDVAHVNRSGAFTISIRMAQTYRKGRGFLAGDSAHCHSPAGGRGMNLGIADAVHFANCLLHDRLDDYAQIRHDEGRKTIALSEGARKIVQSKSKWQRSALVGFARLASHIPPINRMALRRVLDVS